MNWCLIMGINLHPKSSGHALSNEEAKRVVLTVQELLYFAKILTLPFSITEGGG